MGKIETNEPPSQGSTNADTAGNFSRVLYCVRFATLTSSPEASITLAGALRLSVSAVRPECPAPTRSPAESPARRPFLPANYGRSRARPAGRPIRPPRRTGPAPSPALAPIGLSATPANVCPGFQVAHWSARVLPGSLKKKKSFMGGWKGPGQLRGREGLELRRPAAERGGGLGAPRSPARESRAASSGAAMTVSGPGWNPARLGTECPGSSVQTCPLGSLPSSPRGARAVEGSSH